MNTTFQESAIELTRQIDDLLFYVDGKGRNFQERADSIHHLVGVDEIQQLRSIAAENHQLVLSDEFATNGGHREFLDRCQCLVERLEAQVQQPGAASLSISHRPESYASKFIVMATGFTCFLLLAWLVNQTGLPRMITTVPSFLMGALLAMIMLLVAFHMTTRLARHS